MAFAAFLAFDQTVRQHLGDPSDVAATVRPNFQVQRKAGGGPTRPGAVSQIGTWKARRIHV